MKSSRVLALIFCLLGILYVGCARFERDAWVEPAGAPAPNSTPTVRNEGYALLYDLVSKEKDVSKLLIIKKETDQLEAVIKKIADASKRATDTLETLAKQEPPLNLTQTGLPGIEARTRGLIDSETGEALLRSKDVQMEFKLLLTQVEAMNYGSYLTRALLEVEPNPARRKFLEQTGKELTVLRDEVYQMIQNRYVR